MAKKVKPFILNRKDYNRIRRMDHCTMTLWVESVYKSSFKDGVDEANEGVLTAEQVRAALLNIKGFGEKRVTTVCEALENNLKRKGIDCKKDEC